MQYEFLNTEQKRDVLKNKLTALETQHYELSEMLRAISGEGDSVANDAKIVLDRQIREAETMHAGLLEQYKEL